MNANAAKCEVITAPSFSPRRRLLPVLIAACFGQAALANPVGPQVINGQAGFSSQGGVLSVTNTPGAIINWQSFSINPGELTRFIQQNPNSAVLNRIVGQDPTQILGALQSNGRVFLVNPNGIVFGQGAQIDVNGLVASTLNISNEDFINGKLNFKAGDKAANLKNQGAITTPAGGQVYLIAPNVENSGIITSPKGDVMLAAGHTVQLVDSLDPNMQVVLSAPENEALNLGNVIAQGGKTGIYGALIKQRGVVSANSAVVGENGKIAFKASKETILDAGSRTTATGAGKGGEVQVLGERVAMAGDAKIDVSGRTAGGTVLVGGDYQGKNSAVSNAKRTYVSTGAEIKADALQNGDGGKVIVWSDESTGVYGAISARGGEQGGNGGFVETSGKQKLSFNARVDTRAPKGKAGTLLLDPQDIIIANGSGGANDLLLADSIVGASEPDTTSDATISEVTLEGLSGNVTLQASRDVIFNDLTDSLLNLSGVTSGSTFAVTAGRNISLATTGGDVNDRIQTGGGNVSFTTTNGKIDIGGIKSKGGAVTLSAGGTLGDMVVREIITTPGGGNGGAISLTSNGTSYMTLGGGNIDARGISGSAGKVVLKSAAPINVQNGKVIYANQLEMEAVGGITDGASNAISTQVTSLHARNTGTGAIKISNSGGNLSIVDSGSDGYGVKQQTSGQAISITNATGTLEVNAPIVTNNGAVSMTGPGGINLYAAGDITTAGGSLDLITSVAGSKISTAVGAQVSTTGGTVRLTADKMGLLGTIDAKDAGISGSGVVKLAPLGGTLIDVGTADTIDNTTRLELNNDELNRISTGVLVLGDTNSGALDIKTALVGGTGGALQNVSKALSLVSGGAVTQQSGAIIGGGSSVKARGTSVTLNEANGTGVIAGEATTGDFQYTSSSLLTVSTVDSTAGISSTSGKVFLNSTSTLGINQSSGSKVVAPGGLGIKAIGPVVLTDTANDIANVAADLTGGSGNFALYSLNNLTVGGLTTAGASASSGITTVSKDIAVGVAAGKTLTISQPIDTGSTTDITEAGLKADTLVLNNTVTANMVNIRPVTSGRAITVGQATCIASPCLAVFDLYKFVAKTVGIGTDDSSNLPGAITVQGITDGGASPSLATDRNATTTRIGLLTGGTVTQINPINVQDLGVIAAGGVTLSAENQVTNFAARTTNAAVTFTDMTSFDVTTLSGGSTTNNSSYSLPGISTSNGNVTLTLNGTSTSQLGIPGQINAGTGTVTLASSGSVYGSGTSPDITGGVVDITANGTSPVTATGAIDGVGGLHIKAPRISSLIAANGSINIRGFTDLTLGAVSPTEGTAVSAPNGTVTIKTDSPNPLTINGGISAGSNISLTAGAGSADTSTAAALTVNGVVYSTSGTITLAGNSVTGTHIPSGTNVTLQTYTPPTTSTSPPTTSTPPPPTIDQCVANSSLSGCSAVLPSLSACTADPTAAGCSAVLPTVATCTSAPSTAGCTAVLPSVNTCTTAPTTAGCSAVLPTVSTCTAAPSTAGCSAVLPSISICTSAPSTAGCTAVLPTLSTCTSAPSTAGCSAVLPSISTCTAAPSTTGCASVLPTLSTCTSTPATAGCSVVLPTLGACAATPTLDGCSAVLPTISQCSASPLLPGCEVVMPIASQCATHPSAPGCETVLPTTQSGKETVTQTVTSNTNTVVNLVSTSNPQAVAPAGGSGSGSSGGGTTSDKGDEKKADKKTASGPEDNGAKKNEPAKKMYCN